jgi:hypothetical protein
MNMKKSIAGVMAGAMAISAMATVASADQEQIVLSYDLKEYVNLPDVTTASITAKYAESTTGYVIDGLDDGTTDVTFALKNVAHDNYELVSVAISGTQLAREDENGALVTADAPSVTYYSSVALGKKYATDTSGTKQYLADTDNVSCMENSDVNKISDDKKAFTINFATKEKAGTGSYIVDTLAVAAGTTPVAYTTKAAAALASQNESVYTNVEQIKQGTLTYVGDTTGTKYALSNLTSDGQGGYTAVTEKGAAAGDPITKTYTSKDLTAVDSGSGYVVIMLGDQYVNAPLSQYITAADLVDSASKVVGGGQYGTKDEAEAAIKALTSASNTGADVISADSIGYDTNGQDTVLTFRGYYINGTAAEFYTALKAEQAKNSTADLTRTQTVDEAITALLAADNAAETAAAGDVNGGKLLVKNVSDVKDKYAYGSKQDAKDAVYAVDCLGDGSGAADPTLNLSFVSVTPVDISISVTYPGTSATKDKTETVTVSEDTDGLYYLTDSNGVRKSQDVATGTYAFGSYAVTYTVKVYGTSYDAIWAYADVAPAANEIGGAVSKVSLTAADYAQGGTWVATAGVSRSTLTTPMNVINALTAPKEWGNYYTNPVAVINDVIANNEEVAFTFNMVTGAYVTDFDSVTGLTYKVQSDWSGYWGSYSGFGQHLYATSNKNDTKYDGSTYGSYSSAWGTNLFNAGLTVNSAYTMQLSDTTAFTWGDNSITFLWSSITDGKVSNATTFLQSMLLYTPTEWFWDSLDISVGSAISEDIVPGAGIEDDGDVVEDDGEVAVDEGDVDVDFDEEDVDDEFEDEEFDEEDSEDEFEDEEFDEEFDDDFDADDDVDADADTNVDADADTEVKEVESPKTGNAPIALAVIPVALAAAAVVAKKKN